ncbi:MAG: peptidoglycan-binding protein [Ilumatobacteraceae bacterium]
MSAGRRTLPTVVDRTGPVRTIGAVVVMGMLTVAVGCRAGATPSVTGDAPVVDRTERIDASPAPTDAPRESAPTTTGVERPGVTVEPGTTPGIGDQEQLVEGDEGPAVVVLQRMLNRLVGSGLDPNGVFGPDTTSAVRLFRLLHGLGPSGVVDPVTHALLVRLDGGRSTAVPTWRIPGFGLDDPNGCQVSVIGDSLVATRERRYGAALADVGCASFVDGFTSRAMTGGWLCIADDGSGGGPIESVDAPRPGDLACAPGGQRAIDLLVEADALGDLIVVALGTNDAGTNDQSLWSRRWQRVLESTEPLPVVFLTTSARQDTPAFARQQSYSTALRVWCDRIDRCVLADWALTPAALDPASYTDDVHLTSTATAARAAFIAEVVASIRAGRPVIPPEPPPSVTWPPLPTTVPTDSTTSTSIPTSTTSTTTTSTTVGPGE